MRIATVALAVLFVLSAVSSSFAIAVQRPVFRWAQYFRCDEDYSVHNLYVNRLSADFALAGKNKGTLLRLIPFFEARRNPHRDVWERIELGVEIGKDIFPWFYAGQGFQAVWLKEDYLDRPYHDRWESGEAETRFVLSHQLFKRGRLEIKGFALEEYTYDFKVGASTRNEIAMGVIIPVTSYLETQLNWRHLDRIHDFDSDLVEVQATLVF